MWNGVWVTGFWVTDFWVGDEGGGEPTPGPEPITVRYVRTTRRTRSF